MAAQTLSGARAKVSIVKPGVAPILVGVFDNISYGLAYDLQPVYVLGNLQPVESVYTAQEPVRVSASGFRVYDQGPFVQGAMPTVSELLAHEYLTFEIFDRQTDQKVAVIKDLRPQNFDSGFSARQLTQMSLSYLGLSIADESFKDADYNNVDRTDATKWPNG